jgi:hypothetical protein
MKKGIVLLAVALALAIPTSAALANANPTRGKSNPIVMYVLKGTITSYTAAAGTTDGSITINVSHANYHGRQLAAAAPLTFTVTANTRVTMASGLTTISPNSQGVLKFRAPLIRKGNTTLAATLTTSAKALHIIDLSHQ